VLCLPSEQLASLLLLSLVEYKQSRIGGHHLWRYSSHVPELV
jgi:hypothetical protein